MRRFLVVQQIAGIAVSRLIRAFHRPMRLHLRISLNVLSVVCRFDIIGNRLRPISSLTEGRFDRQFGQSFSDQILFG